MMTVSNQKFQQTIGGAGFVPGTPDFLITRNDAWTAGETMGSDSPHCDKDE